MKIRHVLPIALAAIALAGCSDDAGPAGPASSGGPAAASAVSAAPTTAYTSPAPSAGPGAASGAASGCPVTAAVLEKAFKANPEVAGAIVLGKGFKDVSCYGGWATATAQPANLEAAVVLFRYDAAKRVWVAQSGGTDGVCRDTVPADVATHLKGCQN